MLRLLKKPKGISMRSQGMAIIWHNDILTINTSLFVIPICAGS